MESECEDRRIVKLRCYNLLNRCWTDELWFMGIPKLSRSSCFVCRSQRNIANGEMFYWSNQLWNFKEENETPFAYYKSNVWIIEWSIQNMDFPLGMFFFALFRSDQHFSAYIHQSIVVTIIIAANLRFTTYNTRLVVTWTYALVTGSQTIKFTYLHLQQPRSVVSHWWWLRCGCCSSFCLWEPPSTVQTITLLTTIFIGLYEVENVSSLVFAGRQIGKQIINRQT